MELQTGMYVRLHGKIGKITHICMCEQCELRGFYEPVVDWGHNDTDYISVYWKDDIKASYNIIDLIEVEDYVNGECVYSVARNIEKYYVCVETGILFNNQIHSIVTKEQFESMQYRIGE